MIPGADSGALIDLRSDTVTRPGPAMRAAMAAAEVGDDVYDEDPTVRALEQRVATLLGHEAGLFVPSGTMGNQIGVRLLVEPGAELIADADAHVLANEGGGVAAHGGVLTRTLVAADGRGQLDPDVLAGQLRAGDWHTVATRAVAVEQTHNRGGGSVYPLATLRRLRELTRRAGVALHCDGARLWNAHAASGVPLAEYGRLFDSLSVCLSKGLGAPVGSVLVLPAGARSAARRLRHRLGGNMRQAGILAAAGLYALDHHLDRLAVDHANARLLAELLRAGGLSVAEPETNIVLVDLPDAADVAERVREQGVLIGTFGPNRLRLVTHLDVDPAGCERAARALLAAARRESVT